MEGEMVRQAPPSPNCQTTEERVQVGSGLERKKVVQTGVTVIPGSKVDYMYRHEELALQTSHHSPKALAWGSRAGGAQWAARSVTSRQREASGEWRVSGGRLAGAGRPEEALAAGSDPRGAVARLACSVPTPGGGGTMPFDFRRFDIYRKVPKDLTQPTYTGAISSYTCLSPSVNELYVDDPDKDSGGKIDVSLNISLPNLHCE
ncbi:hypothetical protein H8959_022197, partial [Pygathrix nigripes]